MAVTLCGIEGRYVVGVPSERGSLPEGSEVQHFPDSHSARVLLDKFIGDPLAWSMIRSLAQRVSSAADAAHRQSDADLADEVARLLANGWLEAIRIPEPAGGGGVSEPPREEARPSKPSPRPERLESSRPEEAPSPGDGPPPTSEETLRGFVDSCDRTVNQRADRKSETCRSLGNKKHECCDQKIKAHTEAGKPPPLQGETGYGPDGKKLGPPPPSRKRQLGETFGAYMKRIRGTTWPDAAELDANRKPVRFFEFKFACPAGVSVREPGKQPVAAGRRPEDVPGWTRGKNGKPGQLEKIEILSQENGVNPKGKNSSPVLLTNMDGP